MLHSISQQRIVRMTVAVDLQSPCLSPQKTRLAGAERRPQASFAVDGRQHRELLKWQKPPDPPPASRLIHLGDFQTFAAYTGESLHGQCDFRV